MKKLFLFFLSTLLCSGSLNAQRQSVPQQTVVSHNEINKNDSILKELQIIRGIQVEAKQKIDSIRNARKNHATPPDEKAEEDLSNEYEAMTRIADNTRQDWVKDDWNVYGWVAFFIALFSLMVSGVTLWAQWQTEKHTSNAPINVQLSKLKDLPRHFYRNLICTSALIYMFKLEGEEKKRKRYPSESNLAKLKTLPDDIVLPVDVDETKDPKKNPYNYMHELKLLLRNYNIEVETALEHISRKNISDASLKQDYDNLLFKPFFLIRNTFDFEKSLHVQKNKKSRIACLYSKGLEIIRLRNKKDNTIYLAERTLVTILSEHFKKLLNAGNFRVLFEVESAKSYLGSIMNNPSKNFKIIIEGKEQGETGSIERSIETLINYGKEEKADVSVIDREATIEKVIKELNTQSKNYEPFFYGEKNNEGKVTYPGILSISSKKDFLAFCKGAGFITEKKKCNELFDQIAPYLRYLQKKKWDTATLIKYILTIDSAIETDRIGMINYN